jgi:hypothetical protein
MGFGSLQHFRNPRSTTRGLCPPATFRLQGLATLLTACSLESRAGFVSHRQRSWDSPFGGFPFQEASPAFPLGRDPHTVDLQVTPAPKYQTGRAGLSFWGHTSWKCLATDGCLSRRSPAPPLGFTPPGPSRKSLDQGFSRSPLTRFADPAIAHRIHRRPRVSIGSCLAPTSLAPECTLLEATLLGFPHRPRPDHSNSAPPGLWCSPHTGSHITADSPVLLGRLPALPEPIRIGLRCRASRRRESLLSLQFPGLFSLSRRCGLEPG